MLGRNGTIDFLKFIFSIGIILYHSEQFYSKNIFFCGYIAVEFYFIVSGFLLMKEADRLINSSTNKNIFILNLEMIRKKYINIFVYLIGAILASYFFWHKNTFIDFPTILHDIIYSINELFLLQMLGFQGFWATGVAWYLSALFFASFVIFPIILKNKSLFVYYIAPLIIVGIYGYFACVDSTINNPGQWNGFIYKGLLRGLAGLSLGCISYELINKITKNEWNRRIKIVLTATEIIGYLFTIMFIVLYKQWDSMDFFITILIFISVTISFSNRSYLSKIFSHEIFNKLGIFSMSLYLNHYFVAANISRIFVGKTQIELMRIYIIIVFGLALLNSLLGSLLTKKVKRRMYDRK